MVASNTHIRSLAKKRRTDVDFIDEDFIPQRRVIMSVNREKIINAITASVPLAYLDLDFNIAYDEDSYSDEELRVVVASVAEYFKVGCSEAHLIQSRPVVHSKGRLPGFALKRRTIMQTGRKSTKGRQGTYVRQLILLR